MLPSSDCLCVVGLLRGLERNTVSVAGHKVKVVGYIVA